MTNNHFTRAIRAECDRYYPYVHNFLAARLNLIDENDRSTAVLKEGLSQEVRTWTISQPLEPELASKEVMRWHVYVLDCPDMHPVSAGDLLERILFEDAREVCYHMPVLQSQHTVFDRDDDKLCLHFTGYSIWRAAAAGRCDLSPL